MTEKIYLQTLRNALGHSIFHYLPANVLPTLLRAHLHVTHKQYNFNMK